MYQLISRMNRSLAEVCGLSLILMVLFLIVELGSRLIGKPIHGGAILAVFVMVTAIYLGLATCEQRRKHIRMDAVVPLLPERMQRALFIFNYMLLIVLYAAVLYGVSIGAVEAFLINEAEPVGASTIPIWPVKTGLALGIFCYWLQLIANLYQFVSGKGAITDVGNAAAESGQTSSLS